MGISLIHQPAASVGIESLWQSYVFNGREFQEDNHTGSRSIAVRDGYLPVSIAPGETAREDRLPKGTGGIVVFCYLQSSGGKLKPHGSVMPMAGVVVELAAKDLKTAGRTDAEGYLVMALPPGEYELRAAGSSRKVRIEKGKNALIAVRTGKRMVD